MTYAEARAELFNLKGVNEDGSGRRQWGAFGRPGITAGGQVKPKSKRTGFYDTAYGVAPTESEVQAYWKANGGGGSKSSKSRRGASADMAGSAGPAAVAAPSAYTSLLSEAASSLKSQGEKANAENIRRYEEELALARGVYDAGMGKIGDWGGVQSKLNAETAQQNLDAINADLADRGLANSTNRIAAKLNSDRNLALTQQDLSERKSDREIQYDRAATGDIRDVIRSRFDNAPDPNQLMDVYAQLGRAEAMDQARVDAAAKSGRQRNRSLTQRIAANGGPRNGVPAALAGQMAGGMAGRFYGGLNQAIGYANYDPLANAVPSWTSNAYPHLHGESRDSAYYRRVNG